MYSWLRYPFARFTPALILGIFVFRDFDSISFLISAVLILVFVFIILRKSLFKHQALVGMIALLLIVLLGGIRANTYQESKWDAHFSEYMFDGYLGTINDAPRMKDSLSRSVVEVSHIYMNGQWKASSGHVMVYVRSRLHYGDVLFISKRPDEVGPPMNPHEFDYRGYLADRNIYHQSFLGKGEYRIVRNETPSHLIALSLRIRDAAEYSLERYMLDSSAVMVSKALLIGERSSISDELRNAYAHTGAIHILAISGLHLGIIYGFLLFIFGRYRRSWGFVLVSLIILWAFALIAGMPNSVVRAAFMFSVFAIGQLFHRTSNVYNTLFFSAFILLLLNPNAIYDVGFQLSYLAVLGIALTYKPLKRILVVKNNLLNKIWSLTCVSFSAQLLTAPLVVYYFHNISLVFFLSNLLVIPLATGILFLGILFLIISSFELEFISELIAKLIEWMIIAMNTAIKEMEALPGSFVDGLTISIPQLLAVYLFIVGIVLFYYRSKIIWLVMGCVFWVLFIFSILADDISSYQLETTIIYRTPGNLVIDYFDGSYLSTFSERDSHFETVNSRIYLNGSKKADRIKTTEVSIPGKLLLAGGKSVLIIERPLAISGVHQPIKSDYLIISNNAISKLENFKYFEPTLVLLDATNDFWYASRVQGYLTNQGIPVVNIHNRAYVDEQSK